jgi:hypothetical protein
LEVGSMTVRPVWQLPRDADSLTGRGDLSRGTDDAVQRASRAGAAPLTDLAGADPAVDGPATAGFWGSRVASASLRQSRIDAEQAAANLDQIDGARTALRGVQKRVEQLRDVAVVGLSQSLPPMGRVTLQRQVDRTLGEIDTLASTTSLDAQALGLPGAPATARGSAGFPAIGMSALGITDLGVRSPDEAFGTMRLLDRALTRLGATRISLDGATARFERQLTDLTHPPRTASGDAALAGSTAALTSAVRTSEQLRTRSGEAQSAQTVPSAARVRSLLE